MAAQEIIITKTVRNIQNTQGKKAIEHCNCWGCQEMVYDDGMCWYHYQEEYYLSK